MNGYYVEGIDVSKWQGHMDWLKASGKVNHVYIRASAGTYQDPEFMRNWRESKAASFERGAYHYFYVHQPLPEQVELFARLSEAGELTPMLDVEEAGNAMPQEMAEAVFAFLYDYEHMTGRRPGVYTAAWFWDQHMPRCSNAKEFPLWVAHWTDAPAPKLPRDWEGCAPVVWQFAVREDGAEYGAQSLRLDHDRFLVEPKALEPPPQAQVEVAPPEPVPPPPEPEPVTWVKLVQWIVRLLVRLFK